MYKLVITDLAYQDLDHNVSYITVQLASPAAANGLLDDIEACYSHLMCNPLMNEKCRDARLAADGYRKAVIKNYIAVYRVNEEIRAVLILRFFYGAQDYLDLI